MEKLLHTLAYHVIYIFVYVKLLVWFSCLLAGKSLPTEDCE